MANLTGLGRLHIPDERRRMFPMAAPSTQRVYRNHLLHGQVNDQGATPHCVAGASGRAAGYGPDALGQKT